MLLHFSLNSAAYLWCDHEQNNLSPLDFRFLFHKMGLIIWTFLTPVAAKIKRNNVCMKLWNVIYMRYSYHLTNVPFLFCSTSTRKAIVNSSATTLGPETLRMTPRWCGPCMRPRSRVTGSTRKILRSGRPSSAAPWTCWGWSWPRSARH